MDITPFVESLRRDLVAAAGAGGDGACAAAERLALVLDPATRLALMEAVSQAAAEITAEMPSGSVDVRLAGRELEFVVELDTVDDPTSARQAPAPGPDPEDEGVARITLRLPDSVKTRAEELAASSGHSLNTWLVNTVRGAVDVATRTGAIDVDIDLSTLPFGTTGFPGRGRNRNQNRMTGWV
ncbi:MAG: toxin-antitoxin system HicB family antitoxin [Marmoricola sp.]